MGHYDEQYEEKENYYKTMDTVLQVVDEVVGDVMEIFKLGAKKHGNLNFLEPDGNKCTHKEMHDSMFHHLAESFAGNTKDEESGMSPLLHLLARGIIQYYRNSHCIRHPKDRREETGALIGDFILAGESTDRSE